MIQYIYNYDAYLSLTLQIGREIYADKLLGDKLNIDDQALKLKNFNYDEYYKKIKALGNVVTIDDLIISDMYCQVCGTKKLKNRILHTPNKNAKGMPIYDYPCNDIFKIKNDKIILNDNIDRVTANYMIYKRKVIAKIRYANYKCTSIKQIKILSNDIKIDLIVHSLTSEEVKNG